MPGVYEIRFKNEEEPGPLDGEFSPEKLTAPWSGLSEAKIGLFPWSTGYEPPAFARVGWNERGLHVLMYALEETIRADEMRIGGRVCEDSCMEFFIMPFPGEDARYLNFEMNPKAVLHIGLGEGRPDRLHWYTLPEGLSVSHSEHAGEWWAIQYHIPATFIAAQFGGRNISKGCVMRGNFYKCDESLHPHFGVHFPIAAPKPDFHRPECFGPMQLT